MKFVIQTLGERPFRPDRALNVAVFDTVSTSIAHMIESEHHLGEEEVRRVYGELLENEQFKVGYTQATADSENVRRRFEEAQSVRCGMKRQELQAEFDRLKYQVQSIKENVGKSPDGLISLCCQQVCVSICGSLEQCLKGILVEYAKRRSGMQIHRPIEKLCEGYQNPKTTKILELINLFDDNYGRDLKALWDGIPKMRLKKCI